MTTTAAAAIPVAGWLAQNPEAAAQFSLVAQNFEDAPMPLDFSDSIRELRSSAAEGNATAQFLLGHAYQTGFGVSKDMTETARWYAKAAASRGAAAGSVSASPKSFAEAFEAYREAADAGNRGAQIYLGLAYHLGRDVPRNALEAANWYRKAAAQGSGSAECNLGVLYHNGDGIPKDDFEASSWFTRAAARGSAVAQYNLGRMYFAGDGVPRDYAQSAEWLEKAARQGSAPAQVLLSTIYASGHGNSNQSIATAYMWLNLASATEEQARTSRELIEKLVPADQVAEGQKLTREWLSQHRRGIQ
jgi:TPR repeat protein